MTLYSWGEFYETMRDCDGFEEQKEKFEIFEKLDKATTLEEIREIIKPLTTEQTNWLNSPCLDGIVFSIEDPDKKLTEKEFVETFKFYWDKNLILLNMIDAVKLGSIKIVEFLLDQGYNIHAFFDSSIIWACHHGHILIVELLIDRGANIYNYKSLLNACMKGHFHVVKFLIHKLIPSRIEYQEILNFGLFAASREGYYEIVEFLLKNGANNYEEAYIHAAFHRHQKTVEILKDYVSPEFLSRMTAV